MQIGLTGMASLCWPSLRRLRAENAIKPKSERRAIIFVYLPGGQSHIDTYDPKRRSILKRPSPTEHLST